MALRSRSLVWLDVFTSMWQSDAAERQEKHCLVSHTLLSLRNAEQCCLALHDDGRRVARATSEFCSLPGQRLCAKIEHCVSAD